MLIMTTTGTVQFSIGVDYHEISPVTFIEQLTYNATTDKCSAQIVWPESVTGIGTIKQADFQLPPDYQPGSP
jgi:hypothetical protein